MKGASIAVAGVILCLGPTGFAHGDTVDAPTKAAIAQFNICATDYNMGKMSEAIAACDQAIGLDPNKADAYFIKGSALFGNGSVDSRNKYIVPPGAVDALDKYLELAPNGPHAQDVHAMLDSLK